jgi:hypothetical protein
VADPDGPDPAARRTRPQPRGLPPAAALTWCRVQVFRNRRTRQGKSAWTLKLCAATCPAERINPRRPEVTVYVDLMRPAAFRASVAKMATKGTLTPEQATAYESAAEHIQRLGEAEPGRVALLGHVGRKAQGLGTVRFAGQLVSFLMPPGPDAGPVCHVVIGEGDFVVGEFHRLDSEGHDRDPQAARWVGYHDPAGFNEHRKARHGS